MRILRSSIWQFIGAMLTLVSVVTTVVIAVVTIDLSRPRKQLDVVLGEPKPWGSVSGEKATDVYRSQVRVLNSGNQPITEDDFSKPLTFSFLPNQAAEAKVIVSNPGSLPITFTQSAPHEVQMNPTLLNPDDSATIEFKVLGDSSSSGSSIWPFDFAPKVDARIVGVKQIGVSRTYDPSPSITAAWVTRISVVEVIRWLLIANAIIGVLLILLWLLRKLFPGPNPGSTAKQ